MIYAVEMEKTLLDGACQFDLYMIRNKPDSVQSIRRALFCTLIYSLHFLSVNAQVSGVDVVGSPVPSVTAVGHHAMGVNPALFAVPSHVLMEADTLQKKPNGKKGRQVERYVSSFEGYLETSGPVPRHTSLIQLVGGGEAWTMEERRE